MIFVQIENDSQNCDDISDISDRNDRLSLAGDINDIFVVKKNNLAKKFDDTSNTSDISGRRDRLSLEGDINDIFKWARRIVFQKRRYI